MVVQTEATGRVSLDDIADGTESAGGGGSQERKGRDERGELHDGWFSSG